MEHNYTIETAYERKTDDYFFTLREFYNLLAKHLGISIPTDARVEFYNAISPAEMKAQERGEKIDRDKHPAGFNLRIVSVKGA